MDWLFVYPQGMEKLVMYMKERFNNTPIIITENGNRKVTMKNKFRIFRMIDK